MANIAHASLTGAELHEPKGVDNANLGDVYVADGNGSGAWTSISQTSFVGMVSDFTTPIAPAGWLELNGSDINTTTYEALYNAMTIKQNGTRSSGSATITSLPSTTNLRVGYYVFGTGISSGTTIVSIDSSSQITISTNAGSSGTSEVVVSPWLMNTGTIRLPDLVSAGRYRRSRSSFQTMGMSLNDQNQAHTHTGTGTTSTDGLHVHNVAGTTSTENQPHTHNYFAQGNAVSGASGAAFTTYTAALDSLTTNNNQQHVHPFNVTSGGAGSHSHSVSISTSSNGGSEARPATVVFMTCVKY